MGETVRLFPSPTITTARTYTCTIPSKPVQTMAATCHDMHFIRIVDESRPTVDSEFHLMHPAYARQDPAIRYRGFEMSLRASAARPDPVPQSSNKRRVGLRFSAPRPVPGLIASSLLLPLDVARQCKEVPRRREFPRTKEVPVEVPRSFVVVRCYSR